MNTLSSSSSSIPPTSNQNWAAQHAGKLRRTGFYRELALTAPAFVKGAQTVAGAIQSTPVQWIFSVSGKENVKGSWAPSAKVIHATAIGRLTGGLLAGVLGCVDIGVGISDLKKEISRKRPLEGSIAGLQILEAVSSIGDGIAVSAMGLEAVGAIAVGSVLWASPLSVGCALGAAITIPTQMLHIKKAKKLSRSLNATSINLEGQKERPLDWLYRELLADDEYVLKNFGIFDRERAGARIAYISKEGTPQTQKKMVEALQERVKTKISNHKLAITSAVIGVVAVAIIFFLGPLSGGLLIAGFSVMPISAFFSFLNFWRERKSINELDSKLKKLEKEVDPQEGGLNRQWVQKNYLHALPAYPEENPGQELKDLGSNNSLTRA